MIPPTPVARCTVSAPFLGVVSTHLTILACLTRKTNGYGRVITRGVQRSLHHKPIYHAERVKNSRIFRRLGNALPSEVSLPPSVHNFEAVQRRCPLLTALRLVTRM